MKKFLALTVITAVMLVGSGLAWGAAIQFPYVNSNPGNLSTFISVINLASVTDVDCSSSDTLRLHYTYVTKSVDAAHTDACDELNFDRPTTKDDLVTFDFSGNIGDGMALFNDATSYEGGAGAPYFDMPTLGTSEPRRGYVLVNHRCLAGGDRPTSGSLTLDGEAMLFDVVNGAAWNYEALKTAVELTGSPDPYAFADLDCQPWFLPAPVFWGCTGGTDLGGGGEALDDGSSIDLLSEQVTVPSLLWMPNVPLMPPTEITTKLLVTPQVIASNAATTADMSLIGPTQQKRVRIALRSRAGAIGMTNRNEDAVSGGGPVHVRCIAAVDIEELLGLAATAVRNEGGWSHVDLMDPVPLTGVDTMIIGEYDHAAIVFKLEYGAPDWGGGQMMNAARLIKSHKIYMYFNPFFE